MKSVARARARERVAACGIAAALLLSGCNRPVSADTAATVNGKAILRSDVDKYYKNSTGDQKTKPTPEQADVQKLNVLRQLIDEEILQQRAEKLGLTATDAEVEAKLTEMKAPFTQEEFDKRLQQNGLSLDDVKKQLRRNVTLDKLFNKEINSRINVSDSDISSYYEDNKTSYNLVEPSYHLAQIVVTPMQLANGAVPAGKATSDAEAQKKIKMLRQRLDSGDDFGELAKNYSEQPNSAGSGGDMGFLTESQLKTDPMIYAAVQALKPGQYTEVLPFYDNANSPQRKVVAYQIYRLIAKEPAGQRQLNDPRVQQDIRQRIRDARSQLLKTAFTEVLRDDAKVKNYVAEETLKK